MPAAFASQMSAARRKMAERSVCGVAAQAGCAAAGVSHVGRGGDPGPADFLTRGGLDHGGIPARSGGPAAGVDLTTPGCLVHECLDILPRLRAGDSSYYAVWSSR
jgi:hypothetical protein